MRDHTELDRVVARQRAPSDPIHLGTAQPQRCVLRAAMGGGRTEAIKREIGRRPTRRAGRGGPGFVISSVLLIKLIDRSMRF